jgi:hypothetical protein
MEGKGKAFFRGIVLGKKGRRISGGKIATPYPEGVREHANPHAESLKEVSSWPVKCEERKRPRTANPGEALLMI